MKKNCILSVKNLTKKFTLFTNSRERFKNLIGLKSASKSFLAVNNVSFALNKGDFIGVIGKNGSGK